MKKLTGYEECILGNLIAMEIRNNEIKRTYDIEPLYEDEELKVLYEKVMGYKWEKVHKYEK